MRNIKLPQSARLFIWLVLMPAVLFGLGLWQAQRAGETLLQSQTSSQNLNATLAQVKKIAETQPGAVLTFNGDGGQKSFSAVIAVKQIEDALAQADEEAEVSTIRWPFPWGTIGGAVLAFVSGVVGITIATFTGWQARRSQEQLVRSFGRLRLVLPFILAMLVVGICISAVCASLFEAISMGLWADFTAGSAKLFVLALILAGVAAYSAYLALRGLKDVFALFSPEPYEIFGRPIVEADAPGLFQLVGTIAEKQGALRPDTIVVGLTQGFFVTEGELRLWPEKQLIRGRTLYLPAPYLDLLDEPEVAAIIGHELAHFSGEDTLYSQRFAPIYASFWRSITALQQTDGGSFVLHPASVLGYHTLQRFDHAVNHWSRIREFEADRGGVRSSSVLGQASALIRTGLIAPALTHVLELAATGTARPSDLVFETSQLVRNHGWSDPADFLQDRQPHPTDAHPPTIQRIEALGLSLDEKLTMLATRPPKPAGTTFAASLFTHWTALCEQLSRDYLGHLQERHAARKEALETLAAAAPGETVVYDNVKPMIWTMGIIAVLLAGFGLATTVFAAQTGLGRDPITQIVVAAVTFAGAVACILYAAFLHRSAAQPLMILTPASLSASMLHGQVAWTDIAAHQVFASNRFALRLWMDPAATLPGKKWQALYSKIDRKKRVVTIGAMGIRGMKPADFSALIERYHNAAHALKELSRPA